MKYMYVFVGNIAAQNYEKFYLNNSYIHVCMFICRSHYNLKERQIIYSRIRL